MNNKAMMALLVLWLISGAAHADRPVEGGWPTGAALYVDVTADTGRIYCRQRNGHASHLGARVPIWRVGNHTIRSAWVHNSCIEEGYDRRVRDVFGVGYEYRLW